MTPNFALSLFYDGIRMMHRTSGGWTLIGEVALDAENLSAELANLRRTAIALDPAGLRTKILLPNEQIKYISLDTTQTSIEDIHEILDGATPYSVNELAIDFERSGGRTHIAAVARETLTEAESFATKYKFAPVCFAAVAEPLTFSTEVFFGPTSIAKELLGPDGIVERDTEAVKVIGRSVMPAPPPVSDAMPLTMAVTPDPEPAAEPRIALTSEPEDSPAQHPKTDEADATVESDTSVTPSKVKGSASKLIEEPAPAAKAPVAKQPSLPQIDEPVFTSRLRILGAERTGAPDADTAPTMVVPVPSDSTDQNPPLFTRRNDPPILAVPTGAAEGPELRTAEPDAPAVPRPIVMNDIAPPAVNAAPSAQPPKSARPAVAAQKTAKTRGRPRFLALKLTAGLLVFLALVAVWASYVSEDGVAGWFVSEPEAIVLAAPEDISPQLTVADDLVPQETAPLVTETEIASVTPSIAPEGVEIEERSAPPVPIVTTGPGRVLSPGEADRIYAATGVWQRAPRLPSLPESQELDGLDLIAAPTEVTPAPDLQDLAEATALPDLPLVPQLNPPAFGAELPRDEDGFIAASATGTMMPHGVMVYARSPRVKPPMRPTPAIAEPEAVPDADAEPLVDTPEAAITPDAVAAPEGLVVVTGKPPMLPPLRPGTIEIAPETVTPSPAEEVAISPGAVSIAAFRPTVRPDGLSPENPAATIADPALAGLRPSLRPGGLAPAQPDPNVDEALVEALSPEPQDISSVIATIAAAAPPSQLINPTQRAIVASPRPDTRPANFSRVVASAEKLQERQDTSNNARQTSSAVAATPVASASVAPTGAISGSVAQAATVSNVISLRNVNLIGVYGRPSDRRALIRLGNGRYVKVEVGSAFEGGQVTAISDNAMNYVVRGQTYYLALPTG